MQRWRKYGKDRLYVSDTASARVGWVDVSTGAVALEQPEGAEALHAAVNAFCAEHRLTLPLVPETSATAPAGDPARTIPAGPPPTGPAEAVTHAVTYPATTPVPPLDAELVPVDLAQNRPGQGIRAMADAELAAMRERSRIGAFLARAFDVKTDERAWRVGAGGEETVGTKLDKLVRHGWYVLHSVPVGSADSDIDHVVIGYGGVYTLNTKNHPGGRVWVGRHQVRVNGYPTDYLRKSRAEAVRASKLLTAATGFDVDVRPTLVFLTGSLIPDVTIKQRPDDVLVLDRMDIPGVLRRAPRRITPDQVAVIYEQARRSTTWTSPPPRRRAN